MLEPKREIRFYIPERLYNEIQLILLDPYLKRPRYGVMSRVGGKLLQAWVDEVKRKEKDS